MVDISPPNAPMAPPIPTKRAVPFKSFSVIFVTSYIVCAPIPIETSNERATKVSFLFIINVLSSSKLLLHSRICLSSSTASTGRTASATT